MTWFITSRQSNKPNDTRPSPKHVQKWRIIWTWRFRRCAIKVTNVENFLCSRLFVVLGRYVVRERENEDSQVHRDWFTLEEISFLVMVEKRTDKSDGQTLAKGRNYSSVSSQL